MSENDAKRAVEPLPTPPYDVDELFPEEPTLSLPEPAESRRQTVAPTESRPKSSTNVDRGAFTQLLASVQQAGLVVNADAIIAARDRELRAGRYQKAFDIIEGIYVQVNAYIARRQDELRRMETQYRSGAIKMSPKEWMTHVRQEMERTQRIERARRQFARVLDGLTVLRAEQAK